MSDSTDQAEYLRKTFPGLKPISGPPSLFTLNGFGLSLAGSRNKDPQTGASIKSHLIALLFIPVFVLGSYVTAPAPEG